MMSNFPLLLTTSGTIKSFGPGFTPIWVVEIYERCAMLCSLSSRPRICCLGKAWVLIQQEAIVAMDAEMDLLQDIISWMASPSFRKISIIT